jgi:hypothetical protein
MPPPNPAYFAKSMSKKRPVSSDVPLGGRLLAYLAEKVNLSIYTE